MTEHDDASPAQHPSTPAEVGSAPRASDQPADGDAKQGPHVTIPGPGYTEVLGVPRSVFDELVHLRQQAHEREVTLPQWREAYTAMTGDVALPAAAEVEKLEELALEQFLTATRSAGASTDEIERRDHADGLLAYLSALSAPPSDEDVRTVLPAQLERLRARFAGRSQSNPEVLANLDKTARLHRAWLSDIDPTPRDPVTGLPQKAVDAQRSLTHHLLGEVPVGLTEARAEAWLAASDVDREDAAAALAGMYGGAGRDGATEWRLRKSISCLPREVLVNLLEYAAEREEDSPAAAALSQLWREGGLRELVEEFLDRPATQ